MNMITEPIVKIKGYVLAIDYASTSARFLKKIERTNHILTLDSPNLEDALIFHDENQAKSWCLIINKELEEQHSPDRYIPIIYMIGLQELEDESDD